ncbi:MAG: hypothetical protein NTY53_16940 [Kiritimatiellaeota bacterium]|nr:hypothetical protein [Kiritimatiellota bacterium]
MRKKFQALGKGWGGFSSPWKTLCVSLALLGFVLMGNGCAMPHMKIAFFQPDEYGQHIAMDSGRSDAWPSSQYENSWVMPQLQVSFEKGTAKQATGINMGRTLCKN